MPIDSALILKNGTVTASGADTAISVEGGSFVQWEAHFTADASGTSPTLDTVLQASFDGGSTYVELDRFPQFVDSANKGDSGTRVAKVVYIPRATAVPDGRGAQTLVKLRTSHTIGGSATPTFTVAFRLTHMSGLPYGNIGGFTSNANSAVYGPLDRIRSFAA